jgi:hypothetical protein
MLLFYVGVIMDRYLLCDSRQQKILDRIYEYLGFNEILSFEDYLKYIFKGVKSGTGFSNMLNKNFEHIIFYFIKDFPEYEDLQCYWLTEENALDHMKVGEKEEYDPKGLLRYYVKKEFKKLNKSKI